MRTKAVLALDLLEQELELLDEQQRGAILGGVREYWNASNGVSYYRDNPNDPWTACDNLNEVTIRSGNSYNAGNTSNGYYNVQYGTNYSGGYVGGNGGGSSGNSGGSTSNPTSSNGGYIGGSRWTVQGNECVYTYDGGTLAAVTIKPNQYTANDVVGLVLQSFGMASDHAATAAAVLKLEAKGFELASRSFGLVSVLSNLNDAIQERSLEDLGQATLGAALFIPGLNGGVVVIGGTVLFAWEMYEFIQEH
ncbi:hypothetical protein [Dyadobacter sp. 3J3]|uniref:hypothetical protein n=1 Tax=Dyadobacter sp. 3J3 TaxID=2606600 RepID=UPI00135B7A3D|nr:hypothetical protein [Dyadobacter sp. 3J3]